MRLEYSFDVQLKHARKSGLGSGVKMPSECIICGHRRTDKRHTAPCSKKIKQIYAERNR